MLMKFSDWFKKDSVNEAFESDAILNHQVLDEKWEPALSQDASGYAYYFNVPGDNVGTKEKPAYKVSCSYEEYQGIHRSGISFSRNGSHADAGVGVHKDAMLSILKGIGEFIYAKTPEVVEWSAVGKTSRNKITGQKVNPEARKSIYKKWAIRNLFPDYIGISDENWVRKDYYDEKLVKVLKYPPLSSDIKSDDHPGKKRKAQDQLIAAIESNKDEINKARRAEEERLRLERERQRLEALRVKIESPEHNPNKLAIGDIVDLTEVDSYYGQYYGVGKVKNFVDSYGDLNVHIDLPRITNEGPDFNNIVDTVSFKADRVKKETEETKAARIAKKEEERRRQEEQERREKEEEERLAAEERASALELSADPEMNPNGLKVGDNVISFLEDNPLHATHNGLTGTVKEFRKRRKSYYSSSGFVLKVVVDFDDRSKEIVGPYHDSEIDAGLMFKDTPEMRQKIATVQEERKAAIRAQQEADRIEAQRSRHSTRVERATQIQQTPDEIVNDAAHNPNGLRIGDHVITSGGYWRFRNRKAVIISMTKYSWFIEAIVKFIGPNGQLTATEKDYHADQLTKDTSEEAQQRQQRMQSRAQRTLQTHTQIQSNPQNLQIGDTVRALSGRNRNKVGKILRFANINNVIRVTIVDDGGNQFTSQMDNLVKQEVAA